MSAGSIGEDKAVVAVRGAELASSLELTLLAMGLTPVLCDPTDDLPLDHAAILIIGPCTSAARPLAVVKAARTRQWDGVVIVITGDAALLRPALDGVHRLVVLEMPFVGADLIEATRR